MGLSSLEVETNSAEDFLNEGLTDRRDDRGSEVKEVKAAENTSKCNLLINTKAEEKNEAGLVLPILPTKALAFTNQSIRRRRAAIGVEEQQREQILQNYQYQT